MIDFLKNYKYESILPASGEAEFSGHKLLTTTATTAESCFFRKMFFCIHSNQFIVSVAAPLQADRNWHLLTISKFEI
jgi:hypothetical protein